MALPSSSTAFTPGNHTVGSLLGRLWRSRWLVLVASMWIQACGGIGYAFGSFSPLIKSTLGYSQQQISLLGNAKDIGDAIGLISGSLTEILPTWCILAIGGIENLIGYGWLWLVVTQRAPVIPFWAVCILIFIGTNGETYFNTAALVTNVRNFPKSRGHVVGLLKGFTGLCGAIFSQIYLTFLYPDQSAYLLLITLGPTIMSLVVMFIIRPIKEKTGDNSRSESIGFSFIYADCLVLAAYLMAVLLVEDIITISFSLSLIITLILLILVTLPLVTPLVSWYVCTNYPVTTPNPEITTMIGTSRPPAAMPCVQDDDKEITTPLLGASEDQPSMLAVDFTSSDLGHGLYKVGSRAGSFVGSVAFSEMEDEKPSEFDQLPEDIKKKKLSEIRNRFVHAVAEGAVRVKKKGPRRGEDFTLLQAFRKADFWLLFWALVCGSGTGLTAIDNMGQLSESQGYDNSSIFVSMLSIWNFLGRLLGGYTSEMLVRDYALPRSWALVGALALMAVGHFLFAMGWSGALYVGVLLVGVGYGSHWGIVPPIISEIFGMKNFGILYNFYIMASPAGSLFFSGFLAGYLYDIEAAKQQQLGFMTSTGRLSESNTCTGAVCFRSTFLIMMGVCLFGIILSTILSIRTMRVYKMLYGKLESTEVR